MRFVPQGRTTLRDEAASGGGKVARKRRIPQRTCIGCRQVRAKRDMLRIVRTPEGEILFDPTGKRSGRGAYLCPSEACLSAALTTRALAGALKTEIDPATVAELTSALQELIVDAGRDDAANDHVDADRSE